MFTPQAPPADFEWCAESIRSLREHLGQSQAALAKELGIRQQTVSEWETGMYKPRGASVTILTLLAVSSQFPFEKVMNTDKGAPGLIERVQRTREEAGLDGPYSTPRRSADTGPVGHPERPREDGHPRVWQSPSPAPRPQPSHEALPRRTFNRVQPSRFTPGTGSPGVTGRLPEFPM
jgi:DNA-binding XRE family transcriptional regulator